MSKVAIECRDVCKSFGGVAAVTNISLSFPSGKVSALIGPNGAGKTTLFHLISGALRPDRGVISFRNHRIDGLPAWRVARLGVGRLFQDVRVFAKLTVLENVLVAFDGQVGENPLFSLMRWRRVRSQEKEFGQVARRWLTFVGLSGLEGECSEDLSYGQQKLLAVARLLAANVDVLLLDEPTAGLSPQMVRVFLNLLRDLVKQGKSIVVIEHNMTAVLESADWVFFMAEGRLAAFGTPQDVLGDPEVRATYLGGVA